MKLQKKKEATLNKPECDVLICIITLHYCILVVMMDSGRGMSEHLHSAAVFLSLNMADD